MFQIPTNLSIIAPVSRLVCTFSEAKLFRNHTTIHGLICALLHSPGALRILRGPPRGQDPWKFKLRRGTGALGSWGAGVTRVLGIHGRGYSTLALPPSRLRVPLEGTQGIWRLLRLVRVQSGTGVAPRHAHMHV